MKSIRSRDRIERAYQWRPTGAVRLNCPNAPGDVAAHALRFERAEHDPPIGQHDWVQRTGNIQVSNLFNISAKAIVRIVHHEQLQCDRRIPFRWPESVAVARKHNPATGQRTWAHVEYAVIEPGAVFARRAKVVRPIRRARVRRKRLVSEPDDAPRLDVHLE